MFTIGGVHISRGIFTRVFGTDDGRVMQINGSLVPCLYTCYNAVMVCGAQMTLWTVSMDFGQKGNF